MSFKESSQAVAKFVGNYGKTARAYAPAFALIQAARLNNLISVESGDFGTQGKLRQFKMTYYPMVCEAEGDCSDSVCNPGTTLEPKNRFFTITRCTATPVYQLNVADLRLIDDDGASFMDHIRMQIASVLPAARKMLSEQMLDLLVANTGLLPDGTASRRVTFANTTNGAVNATGKFEIERLFSDAGFTNPFILGGAAEVDMWQRSVAVGTPNNGLNTAQLGMSNVYYDGLVNATYGDGGQHIIAFDPSVLKFVAWSQNQGMFATDVQNVTQLDSLFKRGSDGRIRGSFIDPVYQLMWDFDAMFHNCGGTDNQGYYTWQLSLRWDILMMPDQTCNLPGVNGIFHFTACAPVLAPCPTGDAYPTPPESATYAYTPGSIFPLHIGTLVLGGVETHPNVNVANIAELNAVFNSNSAMTFTVAGSTITYTGFSAISGAINGGTANGGKDVAFAEVVE